MGMAFPELVIESVIRDGLEDIKANLEFLDDVFSELTSPYASRKYGATEIQKIKDMITKDNIAVVYALHDGAAKSPAYSIQLGMDGEDTPRTVLGDFEEDQRVTTTDAQVIADRIKQTNVVPSSYSPTTGQVLVPDSVNLVDVRAGFIYVDGAGTEHQIKSGINNAPGNRSFFIAPNSTVDIVNPGLIRSFLTEDQFEIRSVTNKVQILVGVHSKEPLVTRYLYVLLKYILDSRKADLIERCFDRMVLQGSDFTRDLEFQGDRVYNRFLTITGHVMDQWRSDQVNLIDSVDIDATPLAPNPSDPEGSLPNTSEDC